MENQLTIDTKNLLATATQKEIGDLIKPLSHEILLFDSYVAGTTHLDDDTVFTVHPYIGINVPYTDSGIIGGRFEVEGFFNSKADYRYNSRSGAYIVRDHMDVTSRGFLVNTYVDFYTVDGLVAPYVSVGLGGVWHDADLYSMGRHYSDDRSNVAFQVGGGVNFNFTRNVAVDLNLRYTDMGRVWDKTYVDEIDVDSLDLMAGFRLTF